MRMLRFLNLRQGTRLQTAGMALWLAFMLVAVHGHAESTVLKSGDTVAVCGDSLTEQKVYSVFIEDYLLMCQPLANVRTLGCGWGGSTAPHFAAHMQRDVLTFAPSVAVVCYGMNDVRANGSDEVIDSTYRKGLEQVIANFQRSGTREIILSSPPVVDEFYFKNLKHPEVPATEYNAALGRLGDIAKKVAVEKGLRFADIHTPMMAAMRQAKAKLGERYPFSSAGDGVHGGPNEHLVMAYAVLKALGCDGQIGKITVDAATQQAQAAEGHRIVSAVAGKVVIESSRYPFCFFNGTADADQQNAPPQSQFAGNWPNGNAAILPFVPFNQELNRFMLVVKNLKAPRARITWGEQSREFSAVELARGVNLAAEFLRNPFVTAFAAVDRAVIEKQTFETQFISHFLYEQPGLLKAAPTKGAALQQMEAGFRGVHEGMMENCRSKVKPVTHTIQIEELPALGAGIPELNWQQRSDWINVQTAGAKGDGKTDDTAAIQAVLDHLREKPKAGLEKQHVVYFPPGRYRITRTLEITESTGAWLVGHGRTTTLVWDGEAGGRMYLSNGCRYVLYEGLTWDGQDKAAVLCGHQSQYYYETWVRYRHCEFRRARDYGIVVGLGEHKSPSAEMWFQNCRFDHCGTGTGLLAPNDYDNIFDGCEFTDCGTGIQGIRGNWQIRGCRFSGSTVADVKQDNISHGASIRFCVSQGSRRFLESCRDANPMPMQIEGCRIDGWTAKDGAVVIGHPGPLMIFDCTFTHPPQDGPVIILAEKDSFSQSLVESSNSIPPGMTLLKTGAKASVTHVPEGVRPPVLPELERHFLTDQARIPGRVFDAKKDVGAKGDGKTDDTRAVQQCIDAAREHGQDAIAYLPGGDYLLSSTVKVSGADYFIGGSGTLTRLFWAGAAGGTAIEVDMPQRLVLENFVFGPKNETYTRMRHKAGGVSSVLYDQIEVNHWNELPPDGLVCERLPAGAQVRFGLFNGHLRFNDCGQASIFALIHYGPAEVAGAELPKSGFTGFMFHNAALSRPGDPLYALTVKDNQDLVVADYYMEQSARYLLCEGGKRAGKGHVTIGGSKLSTKNVESVVIKDYEGRVWISGADGQCDIDLQKALHFQQEGTRPVSVISAGSSWCEFEPVVEFGPAASFVRLGDVLRGKHRASLSNREPQGGLEAAAAALDDFRQIGALYLQELGGK